MRPRSHNSTWRSNAKNCCIVAIGLNDSELKQLSRSLQDHSGGMILSYETVRDVYASLPRQPVDMTVLGNAGSADATVRLMGWARRHWPGSLNVVVDHGNELTEQQARENGALYFARPLARQTWQHVLDGMKQARTARLTSA
jgi:hypothetical protein